MHTQCLKQHIGGVCLGSPTTTMQTEPEERKESWYPCQIKMLHKPTPASQYPTGKRPVPGQYTLRENWECRSLFSMRWGTAVLFALQKPGCPRRYQTLPSNPQDSQCTEQTEYGTSQGKAKDAVYASWSATHDVIGGMNILSSLFAPLIWNTSHFWNKLFGCQEYLQQSLLHLLTGRSRNRKHLPSGQSSFVRSNLMLFWLCWLGHVPGCIWWWHRCLHRHHKVS